MNKDIESMISSYIDGELSNDDRIIFEKHMNRFSDNLKSVFSL